MRGGPAYDREFFLNVTCGLGTSRLVQGLTDPLRACHVALTRSAPDLGEGYLVDLGAPPHRVSMIDPALRLNPSLTAGRVALFGSSRPDRAPR
jgi:hypothetical protein